MTRDRLRYIFVGLAAGGLLFVGLLILSVGWMPTARAAANDLFVSPHGSGTACTQAAPCDPQTALDQANDGDSLYFAQGVYTGSGAAVITVTKSITLYGGWDGSPTGAVVRDPAAYPSTLDGERQRRVIHLQGDALQPITPTVEGFVIIRGNANDAPFQAGTGGGISGFYATPLIANNVISGNVARTSTVFAYGSGGGIYLKFSPGRVVISGNRVISNVASLNSNGVGGGIYLLNIPGAQVVNNEILSNTAVATGRWGYGGGVSIEGDSQGSVLSGNRVQGNVALVESDLSGSGRGYGGGIDIASPSVLVTGNDVLSNTAVISGGLGYGGGIRIASGQAITVADNRIEHNIVQVNQTTLAGSRGGGLYCYAAPDALIRDNTIRFNIASVQDRGEGGGIELWWRCDRALVTGNLIAGNQAATGLVAGYGGGMHIYASFDVRLEANRILSNTANTHAGSLGGGLYFVRSVSFTMTNNIVADNLATHRGGGLCFDGWSTGPITGTLVHNTFAANDKGQGDGRVAIDVLANVTLVLTNNLIYSHTYGVYASTGSTVTLDSTLFYANSLGDTGGSGSIVNTRPITGQDPLLSDDYHLRSGSPAVDAGAALSWPGTDIDGDPRPIGPAPDIGADEIYRRVYLPLVFRHTP